MQARTRRPSSIHAALSFPVTAILRAAELPCHRPGDPRVVSCALELHDPLISDQSADRQSAGPAGNRPDDAAGLLSRQPASSNQQAGHLGITGPQRRQPGAGAVHAGDLRPAEDPGVDGPRVCGPVRRRGRRCSTSCAACRRCAVATSSGPTCIRADSRSGSAPPTARRTWRRSGDGRSAAAARRRWTDGAGGAQHGRIVSRNCKRWQAAMTSGDF